MAVPKMMPMTTSKAGKKAAPGAKTMPQGLKAPVIYYGPIYSKGDGKAERKTFSRKVLEMLREKSQGTSVKIVVNPFSGDLTRAFTNKELQGSDFVILDLTGEPVAAVIDFTLAAQLGKPIYLLTSKRAAKDLSLLSEQPNVHIMPYQYTGDLMKVIRRILEISGMVEEIDLGGSTDGEDDDTATS